MKTVEELLRPRYKVIADYPQSSLKVGDIISFELQHVEIAKYTALNGDPIKLAVMEKTVQKYPHLFQPLPWWSDRAVEDMPEYLYCPSRKMFFRVERWHKSYFIIDGRQKMQYGNYIPATREEYELFKQQKEKL